jgi:DegV family protein with EDD domain
MPSPSARIRIVTDTTASVPPAFAAAHQVEVVPQVVIFGGESFLEEKELSYAEYIRRLKSSPQLPKTAAPPPGVLVEAYRRQLAAAATVLSIHPSVDVSGTIRSAQTAQASFPRADIRLLDTRTVGGNLATLVQLAVEWAEGGMGADEIMTRLQALIPRERTYFLVATLEYLQKGGRIGGAAALIGGLLQIKPLLELKDGHIEPLERVRTHHLALERLKVLVRENCPRPAEAHVCVMHADDEDEAQGLARDLRASLGVAAIPIYSLGAAITTHAGPGALGVGFFA